MKRWLSAISLFFTAFFFAAPSMAEDPVYTGFFSNKAVDGYDTVAYFTQNKPVKGKKQFMMEYMGADWYFSTRENLEKFRNAPKKYAPQYGGYCAWAIAEKSDFAPGAPNQWTIVNNKLYLNYNRDIQDKWLMDVPGFISQGDKNWPMLFKNSALSH